ncbi:MAG: hypothetical protein AAGI11_04985 [Pseudomonadota bacterium]
MSHQTESRRALREFIDLLEEVDTRWASEEWNLHSEGDIAAAHRALMHLIDGGIGTMFENDPAAPVMRQIVTPTRKFTGDNADAIYFDAPVSADYEYLVRGNMNGAVYVSITLEEGTEDGSLGTRAADIINDSQFDTDNSGNFEIRLGGAPSERNHMPLTAGASRITTRHYYENAVCAAKDPDAIPSLSISVLNRPASPPPPDDLSIAAGIRRAAQFVRTRTIGMPPMAQTAGQFPFLSITPNEFPTPCPPGDLGLSAIDAAYSMAPYFLGPDEALVITGRWPACRMANVCLWTRFQQTYDYATRQVSLNRAQTQLESDGSFRMVLAHRDPGCPNWLDTEGRPLGIVFWRYFLPEGAVATPQARVVPFGELAAT